MKSWARYTSFVSAHNANLRAAVRGFAGKWGAVLKTPKHGRPAVPPESGIICCNLTDVSDARRGVNVYTYACYFSLCPTGGSTHLIDRIAFLNDPIAILLHYVEEVTSEPADIAHSSGIGQTGGSPWGVQVFGLNVKG